MIPAQDGVALLEPLHHDDVIACVVVTHRTCNGCRLQDDQLGSVLGSRTCPWDVTLQNITVRGDDRGSNAGPSQCLRLATSCLM